MRKGLIKLGAALVAGMCVCGAFAAQTSVCEPTLQSVALQQSGDFSAEQASEAAGGTEVSAEEPVVLIDEDGCGYVDGELIITAAQDASKNDVEAALNACGAQVSNIETLISDSDDGYTYLSVDYSSGQDPQELCELLSGNSAVAEASVDHVYTLADEADESGEG